MQTYGSALFLLAIVVVGFAVRRIGRIWQDRRRLHALPEVSDAVREGVEVRVTGIVRVITETLTAPLTGRTCVLYQARITAGDVGRLARLGRRGAIGGGSFDLARESFALRPFTVVRDDGTAVVVDGAAADLRLPRSPAGDHESDRCDQLRLALAVPRGMSARFDEVALAPDTRVTVTGFVVRDVTTEPPRGEVGYRDGAPPTLRVTGTRARPLTIQLA